jgi:hypothetical protein
MTPLSHRPFALLPLRPAMSDALFIAPLPPAVTAASHVAAALHTPAAVSTHHRLPPPPPLPACVHNQSRSQRAIEQSIGKHDDDWGERRATDASAMAAWPRDDSASSFLLMCWCCGGRMYRVPCRFDVALTLSMLLSSLLPPSSSSSSCIRRHHQYMRTLHNQ